MASTIYKFWYLLQWDRVKKNPIVRMQWDLGCKCGSRRNIFETQESEILENEMILP